VRVVEADRCPGGGGVEDEVAVTVDAVVGPGGSTR
jgi:hypothetical protein